MGAVLGVLVGLCVAFGDRVGFAVGNLLGLTVGVEVAVGWSTAPEAGEAVEEAAGAGAPLIASVGLSGEVLGMGPGVGAADPGIVMGLGLAVLRWTITGTIAPSISIASVAGQQHSMNSQYQLQPLNHEKS